MIFDKCMHTSFKMEPNPDSPKLCIGLFLFILYEITTHLFLRRKANDEIGAERGSGRLLVLHDELLSIWDGECSI